MNYVIEKEEQIKKETKDLEDLWDMYFYTEERTSAYPTGNGAIIVIKYIPIRRIYTTDADVAIFRQKEEAFIHLLA